MGARRATLSEWLRGRGGIPATSLERLARVLGIELAAAEKNHGGD